MSFTLPELPGLTLDVSYDPVTALITLVGTDTAGTETVRASVFAGTVPAAPAPTYVQLGPPVVDPPAAPDATPPA